MCFPRGTTTLDEGLKKKRQGKVPQRNWKQSFAARICSLQKTFPLLTEGRPSPRNLSFCHPSQHEILNPKGKTNMYVFCVIGRKAVLIVSFFAYSCQKEHLPQVTVVSGWRVVFPSAWNKDRWVILRDWGLGAGFLLLLEVHEVASCTGIQKYRYFKLQNQNSSEKLIRTLRKAWRNSQKQGRWRSSLVERAVLCSIGLTGHAALMEKSSNPVPETWPAPLSTYNQMSRLIFNEQIKIQQ